MQLADTIFMSWPETPEMLEHLALEDAYHESQQAMVNAYFENWRLGKCVRLDETQEMVLGLLLRMPVIPDYVWEQVREIERLMMLAPFLPVRFGKDPEPKSATTYGLLA